MAAAGVVGNAYTVESYHSLHSMLGALTRVIRSADEALQGQILAARGESITPEQYKEIKEVHSTHQCSHRSPQL